MLREDYEGTFAAIFIVAKSDRLWLVSSNYFIQHELRYLVKRISVVRSRIVAVRCIRESRVRDGRGLCSRFQGIGLTNSTSRASMTT